MPTRQVSLSERTSHRLALVRGVRVGVWPSFGTPLVLLLDLVISASRKAKPPYTCHLSVSCPLTVASKPSVRCSPASTRLAGLAGSVVFMLVRSRRNSAAVTARRLSSRSHLAPTS
ncbi:hypothetical protein D3C79_878480 [compost metagenome]